MTATIPNASPRLWDRITCAVDGGAASLEAAREVAWLMPAGAQMTLLTVDERESPDRVHMLLDELERRDATLVAAANIRSGHVASLGLGPLVLALLREAPCSVLVTREKTPAHRRGGAVVIGLDGSGGGVGALSVARELALRRSRQLRVLEDPEPAVNALLDAAVNAELLVLGTSPAPAAPGSIAEQVVRRASCPVLVVRGPQLGVE